MFRYSLVGGGLQVASPPAPKRYETNKTENYYEKEQKKDGICAVQIIQARRSNPYGRSCRSDRNLLRFARLAQKQDRRV